ncbi:hypothetical protein V5O48_009289 [Marasmius crinis-equi]|uniref:DUF6534 domain-containing protein n=1 Tax=Marasmius crinis-equi TaxID=585013 RepID=A0ABR3FBI9_9AGAR
MSIDVAAVRGEDYIWLTLPRLLAFAFNWCLLGALTVQLYTYYVSFRDPPFFKFLVYSLYLLDIAQTCSATYDAAQWFGYRWGDTYAIDNLYTTFLNVPLFTSIIGAVVQVFFGWRIWCFSKSNILYGFIILMAVVQLGGAGVTSYFLVKFPREGIPVPGLPKSVGVRLGTSAAVDIVIAACMTYYLLRNRHDFSMQTNAIVTKLVRLTIETGTVTAAAAIIDLVFFLSLKHNALHQLSGVTLSKLYTNSLLMLFNNRIQTRNGLAPVEESWARTGSTANPASRPGWNYGRRQQPTEVVSLEFEAVLRLLGAEMGRKRCRLAAKADPEPLVVQPQEQSTIFRKEGDRKGLELPNEIVDLIVDQVEDLSPLTLVSRQWYHPAQSRIYYHITVSCADACKYWSRKFKKWPHLGSFVRELSLSDASDNCLESPYMRTQPAKTLFAALTGLRDLDVSYFRRWGPVEQRLLKRLQNVDSLSIRNIPGMSRSKDLPDLVSAFPKLRWLILMGGIGKEYDYDQPTLSGESKEILSVSSASVPTRLVDALSLSDVEISHDQLRWFTSPAFDLSKLELLAMKWSDFPEIPPSPPSFSAFDNLIVHVGNFLPALDLGFPNRGTRSEEFTTSPCARDIDDLLTEHLISSRILRHATALQHVRLDHFSFEANLCVGLCTSVPILKTLSASHIHTIELNAGVTMFGDHQIEQYFSLPEWQELDELLVGGAFPALRSVQITLNILWFYGTIDAGNRDFRSALETRGLPKVQSKGWLELEITSVSGHV